MFLKVILLFGLSSFLAMGAEVSLVIAAKEFSKTLAAGFIDTADGSTYGKEIPLAEAAQDFSKTIAAGGIVTAEGFTFSQAGKFTDPKIPAEKRIFEIGSITKVFTGLLLTQAIVEKKVTLDTPISTLLGDLVFKDPRVGEITLRQLACHTSGLPRLPANFDEGSTNQLDPYVHYNRDQLDQALANLQLDAAAPQEWTYSNFAVGLLGDLLSRLYDKSWEELVREKITGPLKMSDTVVTLNADQKKRLTVPYFDDEKVAGWHFQALAGAGALRSTAADMVIFGNALLYPEKTPFEEALKLLIKSRSHDGKNRLSLLPHNKEGFDVIWHGGGTGGYRTHFEVIPSKESVRVILINNTSLDPASIINLSNGEILNTNKERESRILPVEKLAEYPGVYLIEGTELNGEKFTVIQKGDELWGKLSGQSYLPYHAAEKADCFFLKEVGAEFQFGREGGKVNTLTLFEAGQAYRALRTDEALPKDEGGILTKEEAKEYLGSYQLTPEFKITIKHVGGNLMARLTGQPFLPIIRKEKDTFVYEEIEASLEFERNKDKEIIALKLHQNGIVQRAVKK